jgi:hypothetical protein
MCPRTKSDGLKRWEVIDFRQDVDPDLLAKQRSVASVAVGRR